MMNKKAEVSTGVAISSSLIGIIMALMIAVYIVIPIMNSDTAIRECEDDVFTTYNVTGDNCYNPLNTSQTPLEPTSYGFSAVEITLLGLGSLLLVLGFIFTVGKKFGLVKK